jgi:DHA1 family bicyclomycin/chloramphenicol resistance-like MFS transporter
VILSTEAVAPARSDRSVIAFLAFIGILMAFGIDAALPAFDELRTDFDLDARGVSPAITGTFYLTGMAIGQLLCGVLSDRLGRRTVLAGGLILYGLGAVASALAPGLALLLAARLVWGLGASAPSVLRFAIARDLYSGDRMARVIATFSAVFLIGPIFVPFIGEAILLVGSWRAIFLLGVVLAAIAVVWTVRFGETMAAEFRRPIRFGPFADAFSSVVRTPVTLWALVGSTLFTASFFVWLGSSQPILDRVYDRDDQFTLFFGLSGAGMALALLLNNRLIDRFGTASMLRVSAVAHVATTAVVLLLVVAADGVPSVWLWFAWAVVSNALTMVINPMASALAMEPMADKAGTASAILGLSQLGVGAVLAAVVDARIDATVTPMLAGGAVFGSAGLAALLRATDRQPISSGISALRRPT